DRDSSSQNRCLAKIFSILFYPEASSLCLLSNREVRKDEPPEPSKAIPQISFGAAWRPIAPGSIRETPPLSFDAAIKIKSDTVQPDRWPSFITSRLARRYTGCRP